MLASIHLLGWLSFFLILLGVLLVGAYYLFKHPVSQDASFFEGIVMAHRALVEGMPENTLLALRQSAHQQSNRGVEIDVQLTKDNASILMHDDTVDRTTNGHGLVANFTLAELKNLSILQEGVLTTEKIPTLTEALLLIKELNLKADIELKFSANYKLLVKQAVELIQQHNLHQQVFLSSFYPQILYYVRKLDKNIITGLAFFRNSFPQSPFFSTLYYWSVLTWFPTFLGVGLIAPYKNLLSLNFVAYWKKRNISTITWTVNRTAEKQWLAANRIAYQTDCCEKECPEVDYSPWVERSP